MNTLEKIQITQNLDDYNPIIDPYEDANDTDIECPVCFKLLKVVSTANGPDDFTNTLVCTNCGYKEEE